MCEGKHSITWCEDIYEEGGYERHSTVRARDSAIGLTRLLSHSFLIDANGAESCGRSGAMDMPCVCRLSRLEVAACGSQQCRLMNE